MKKKQVNVRFTKREKEVIDLISEGLCDKHICLILNIGYGTLRDHIDRIFLKTRSDGRIKMLKTLQYIKKPDNLQQIMEEL